MEEENRNIPTSEDMGSKDQTHENKKNLLISFEEMGGAYLPPTFKVGRQAFFRMRSVERDLFSEERERNSGPYVISGIDREKLSKKNLTETDLMAFNAAIYKALYNQSYISGNLETNSGLTKIAVRKATEAQRAEAQYKADREKDPKKRKALEIEAIKRIAYRGEVVVALHDLCKDGYGDTKATTLHKKAMDNLIWLLDSTPVTIHYANRDVDGTFIGKVMDFSQTTYKTEKGEKKGTTYYHLSLNPAYTEDVVRSYGELPQNAIEQLAANTKKLTAPSMKLLILLSIQTKERPFIRTLAELLDEIGIDTDTYNINKSRIEKQIIDLCGTMLKVGIISSYTPDYIITARGRTQLTKVTFILNKDYGKEAAKKE